MLLHYVVKFENPKMLPNVHVFNVRSYITCHKNIKLMILLKSVQHYEV